MTDFEIKSRVKVFNGHLIRFSHLSKETKTTMTCAVYIPIVTMENAKFPTLLYLSGLTCTDENVCQKSGVFRYLSEAKMGFIAPDTSPRGAGIPGDKDQWDLGEGAGFYVDATEQLWAPHYRMYSYITVELLDVIKQHFGELDMAK